MRERFTIDGSDALEADLSDLCAVIARAVQKIVPPQKFQALVLAGGYGRGEGGVLRSDQGDKPYNDIEFYVFVEGNPFFNERHYRKPLQELGDNLSPEAGLHVEFKVESISKLRNGPVSMFSYDLVSRHRIIAGDHDIFQSCEHHLDANNIPISEGTRLLLNRCTGLLLVREVLDRGDLTEEENHFVGRNLAKVKLAVGDALLAGLHRYHWSCRERHARLIALATTSTSEACLARRLIACHAEGVEFKLHPAHFARSVADFATEHEHLCEVSSDIWLWLESTRLDQPLPSLDDYAMTYKPRERNGFSWRNYALNARTFGLGALFDPMSGQYPRERLLCSLPLLLQRKEVSRQPIMRQHLQKQLRTTASDWPGLVQAYKEVWAGYA